MSFKKIKALDEELQSLQDKYFALLKELEDDDRFSEAYKAEKRAELTTQYRAKVRAQAERLWGATQDWLTDAELALRQAREEEAARWDWQRLNFLVQEFKGKLRASTLSDIRKEYERVKASGDEHLGRAFRVATYDIIGSRFADGPQWDDAARFLRDMAADVPVDPAIEGAEEELKLAQRIAGQVKNNILAAGERLFGAPGLWEKPAFGDIVDWEWKEEDRPKAGTQYGGKELT